MAQFLFVSVPAYNGGMPEHTIDPVYDASCRVLILGSFPSVKSRETAFFYGHPQNRFWKVLASVFDCPVPVTIEEKKQFLLAHHIALWDVIASCSIEGSADSTIGNVTATDIRPLLENSAITHIITNGSKAAQLYKKHQFPTVQIPAISLPSTSPANASWSLDRLGEAWKIVKDLAADK